MIYKIKYILIQYYVWFLALVSYFIFVLIVGPRFFSLSTMETLLHSAVPLAFLSMAEAVVLIGGNFDLSIGALMGFSAVTAGYLFMNGFFQGSPFLQILLPILIGLGGGLINGVLVGYIRLNPFLVTLATSMAFVGATYIISPFTINEGFTSLYLSIGRQPHYAILLFIGALFFLQFIFRRTAFGRYSYAIGSSAESSVRLGINLKKQIALLYGVGGMLCGISAILYTGYVGMVIPAVGLKKLMPAFAGAVLGGISITGGRGSLINVGGGVLTLSIVGGGLSMIGVSSYWQEVIYGIIILAAIVFNRYRTKMLDQMKG